MTDGEKVADSVKLESSTLSENAMVIRRLEEIKLHLLSFDYDETTVSEDSKNET